MKLRAVLFDFDDTLTIPGGLDYALIRSEMGCPEGESILDYLERTEVPEAREQASAILDRHEMNGAAKAHPAPGAEELISWLRTRGLSRGILTRNSQAAVIRSLANFLSISTGDFDLIITRDDDLPVKPEPDGVLHAAERFGLRPEELLVVGDYIYDIQAGNAAGAVTAFIASRKDAGFVPPPSDYSIERLAQIRRIVERHR